MSEEAHIIEIDSIVLDRVDLRNPRALRALVESETRRVLLRSGLTASSVVAGTEATIAAEVGRSVDLAINKNAGTSDA
jgi:hypothetical protein